MGLAHYNDRCSTCGHLSAFGGKHRCDTAFLLGADGPSAGALIWHRPGFLPATAGAALLTVQNDAWAGESGGAVYALNSARRNPDTLVTGGTGFLPATASAALLTVQNDAWAGGSGGAVYALNSARRNPDTLVMGGTGFLPATASAALLTVQNDAWAGGSDGAGSALSSICWNSGLLAAGGTGCAMLRPWEVVRDCGTAAYTPAAMPSRSGRSPYDAPEFIGGGVATSTWDLVSRNAGAAMPHSLAALQVDGRCDECWSMTGVRATVSDLDGLRTELTEVRTYLIGRIGAAKRAATRIVRDVEDQLGGRLGIVEADVRATLRTIWRHEDDLRFIRDGFDILATRLDEQERAQAIGAAFSLFWTALPVWLQALAGR